MKNYYARFEPIKSPPFYDVRKLYISKNGKIITKVVSRQIERSIKTKLDVFIPKVRFDNDEDFISQFSKIKNKLPRKQVKKKKSKKLTNVSDYRVFLKSEYWNEQRKKIFLKFGGRCCFCNCKERLQVHHRTYNHIGEGKEELEDLFLLCNHCHETLHKVRPIDGKIRWEDKENGDYNEELIKEVESQKLTIEEMEEMLIPKGQ